MASQEDIDGQRRRLERHRHTLARYLERHAQRDTAYVPPDVSLGIDQARDNIRRIKAILREWGVDVADHPDDADALSVTVPDVQAQQHVRDRAILEYIGHVQGQEANQATNVEEADISQALHLTSRHVRASLTRLKRAGAIDLVDSHDGMIAWITDEGWELLDEAEAS